MYETILVITSPLVLFIMLVVFLVIGFAVSATSGDFTLNGSGRHAASGMAVFLLLVFTVSLVDIELSCSLLIDNNLLQVEFVVLIFYSMYQQAWYYFKNFDIR